MTDKYNVLDLVGLSSMITYNILFINGRAPYDNLMTLGLWIATMCAGMKALSNIRVIGMFRTLIAIIVQTMSDMTAFAVILMAIIVLFSNLQRITKAHATYDEWKSK